MTVVAIRNGSSLAIGRKSWPLTGLESPWETMTSGSVELIGSSLGAKAYGDMFAEQPWIYTVVTKIARAVARLPLKSYSLDEQTGNRERLRDHPLADLLRQPYPLGSQYSLIESMCGSLGIHGNSLSAKVRDPDSQVTTELWPLDWGRVSVNAGSTRPISSYTFTGPLGSRVFAPEDVVHVRFLAPDGRSGISPLRPLARTLALEDAGQRYAISSFQNAARPAGAVSTPGKLNPQQRAELKAEIAAAHQGPDNAFRIALLDGGMDWKPFSHTAQEAELISHRKLNREEVAAVFQIDPTQIGILDRATFSNVESAHLSFYMDTIAPWTTMIEDALMVQLVRPERGFADTFVEFDMADVLKGNLTERFKAYKDAMGGGSWATANEIRRLENLPPVNDRGADSIYAPLNMVALDGRIPSPEGSPVGSPALA